MGQRTWEHIKDLFNEVLEAGPDRREGILESEPGEVRREVEALLAAHERAKDAGDEDHPGPEGPGSRIGRYKVLQEIGEGGFGVVYMAEQEEPVRRKVALKVIKLGMDTKQVDRPLRGGAAGAGASWTTRTSRRSSTPGPPRRDAPTS
jgi:hypothetical protein